MHEEMRNAYKIFVGNLNGRYDLGEVGIDRRIILKLILKETGCEGVDWIQLAQSRVREHSNEHWGYCKKWGHFLVQVSHCQLSATSLHHAARKPFTELLRNFLQLNIIS
jgi:hypothetical protein